MEDKFAFSCECNEPKIGKIKREVFITSLTPENIEKMYEKAKKFKHLMGFEIPTYEHFVAYFVTPDSQGNFNPRGILARIDDFVGVFWLTDIDIEHNKASIHYTFFDKRHAGRIQLCREAIKYVFRTYGFDELFTLVPLYMRQAQKANENKISVLDFVEKIGFKKQERLRDRVEFSGHTFDANLYTLNKKEVLDGDLLSIVDH